MDPSPYTPPASQLEEPRSEAPSSTKPRVIAVLAVINLIFAVAGLIFALASVAVIFMRIAKPDFVRANVPLPLTIGITVFAFIHAGLIGLAGVRLKAGRRNALATANLCAIVSIVGNLLKMALAFTLVSKPEVMNSLLFTAGTLFYPMLCLVLLNRQQVRNWLAVYGT